MTQKDDAEPEKQSGIDVDKITFGEDGESAGLDDDDLDSISGGLLSTDDNGNCNCTNNCG
jgi:hypothetical protein